MSLCHRTESRALAKPLGASEKIAAYSLRSLCKRVLLVIFCALGYSAPTLYGYSTLNNNDPLPVYTAEYPYDYLSLWEREYYRGLDDEIHQENWSLTISPFRQTANSGNDPDGNFAFIGDIPGRWNMLALFYPNNLSDLGGADPCNLLPLLNLKLTGTDSCPTNPTTACCPTVINPCSDPIISCTQIIEPALSDPTQHVGFFQIPIDYRKYGMRFQFDIRFLKQFGLRVQFGAADLTQTVTAFNDLTLTSSGINIPTACASTTSCLDTDPLCKELISGFIMDQREILAKALGISLKNFHTTGFEDTYLTLFWQDVKPVNDECDGWPFFLFVPYAAFEAVLPTSKCANINKAFSKPLGNNGHLGLGFSCGMDFDFINSISVGFQASMTRWTERCYQNVPLPTNAFQQGIYLYRANFNLQPGTNWTFSATLKAHYFLDRLSAYGQYEVVSHSQDKFCNVRVLPCSRNPSNPPPPPCIQKMQENSKWRVHVFNFGFTYDIAPHCALGFLWQAPLARHNAYRSSTVLFSAIFRY